MAGLECHLSLNSLTDSKATSGHCLDVKVRDIKFPCEGIAAS